MSMKTFSLLLVIAAGVIWAIGIGLLFGSLAAAIAVSGYALGCFGITVSEVTDDD